MSVKIMGKVWELDLPHNQLLVLLSLADHADHQGNNVFPSLGLTAWKTGYSEQQVRRILRDLEAAKILVATDRKPGRPTVYKIDLSAGKLKPDYVYTPSKMSGVSKSKRLKTPDPLHFEHSTPYIPPEENTSINRIEPLIQEKEKEKEKMDSQQAPDGAATNGASAGIPSSPIQSKNPKAQKPSKAKPKKKATPPPPPKPRKKRKSERELLLEDLEPCIPLAKALLPLAMKDYDSTMHDPVTFLGKYIDLLRVNVPRIRELFDDGAKPEEMSEVHRYIKNLSNYKNTSPTITSFCKNYQGWKAWKTRQAQPNGGAVHPNGNGAGRPKVPPLVHTNLATPEQAAENLKLLREFRRKHG